MNVHREEPQYFLDFRTGRSTCIVGDQISHEQWRGCAELNRTRQSAILDATRPPPHGEPLTDDVWADIVASRIEQQELPFIPLKNLGLYRDDIGNICSDELQFISSGKEAHAFLDRDIPCFYKLFYVNILGEHGYLGQKLVFTQDSDFECSVSFANADPGHVMEKLRILHLAGACPTEIVGLSEGGYFLVAKQLKCELEVPGALEADRREAVKFIRGVMPTGTYQQPLWVFWLENKAWAISDLHKGNIRRMHSGVPTIIDALIGEIPLSIIQSVPQIGRAVRSARKWRETGEYDLTPGLTHGDDSEL